MTDIALAPARFADAAPIATTSRHLIEHGLGWSWTPTRVRAAIRSPKRLVVVARAAERLAGFGVMRYDDEEAHLELLGVEHARQRTGLGRRLVEWLEKPALVAGISTVFLEVRESNRAARAFYVRLGYRELEILPRYYQGREAAIRMTRTLGFARQTLGT